MNRTAKLTTILLGVGLNIDKEISFMNKGNSDQIDTTIDMERLLFRRQYILGPRAFTPNRYWSSVQLLHGLHLSTHVDIPFYSITKQGITVILIGQAINPYKPYARESDILHSLLEKASNLEQIIESAKPLIGRWVVIFQDSKDTILFTDPCGFRQIYYLRDEKEFWCASQPELIKANYPLHFNTDPLLMFFLTHPAHVQQESPWIGSSTLYKNCIHLLPNHYLSVDNKEQVRFYPKNSISNMTTSEIVKSASLILKGAITALSNRYKVSLALSSGMDSRVLLSASRHVKNDIDYFVYQHSNLSANHPDIWVPKKIAKELGIKFAVKIPSYHIPGWFVTLLSHNVTNARILPKTSNIYDKLVTGDTKVNINGNASEICRNHFDKYCKVDKNNISTEELAIRLLDDEHIPAFAIREIEKWRNNLKISTFSNGLNILDFLYWEQRLGNWGAQYPAEQDIAIEEISPFNSRELIEILSASPRKLRTAPDYPLYRMLIKEMWPEVLEFPINPLGKIDAISNLKKKIIPYIPTSIARKLKKIIKK